MPSWWSTIRRRIHILRMWPTHWNHKSKKRFVSLTSATTSTEKDQHEGSRANPMHIKLTAEHQRNFSTKYYSPIFTSKLCIVSCVFVCSQQINSDDKHRLKNVIMITLWTNTHHVCGVRCGWCTKKLDYYHSQWIIWIIPYECSLNDKYKTCVSCVVIN